MDDQAYILLTGRCCFAPLWLFQRFHLELHKPKKKKIDRMNIWAHGKQDGCEDIRPVAKPT